ncbi:potassium transporter TrkA [Leucobacter sp. gxy201]|uniref:cation:proton antiporter regulatory subunit n=1 Tax=Leucobacter sp. gxy201 TaxID=2957200 RepID=UPI003DA09CC0
MSESPLPGIGIRDDFLTATGRRVGVISHRNGRRDLLVYAEDDPDACAQTISLSAGEADTLAEFLGTKRVIERLSALSDQVDGIATEKFEIERGAKYDGAALGAMQVRSRTGASIVAVLRHGDAIPSPTPAFVLQGDDRIITVGTSEALALVRAILDER